MREIGRYNTELKLFQEAFNGFDYPRLRFERWLLVNGLGEHSVSGPMSGELMPGMYARFGRDSLKSLNPPTTHAEKLRAATLYDQTIK